MQRTSTIVLVVLSALACMALVYFLRVEWFTAALAAKMLASLGFVVTAISVGALRHRYGQVILAGLLLSMTGDAVLTDTSQQAFLLGLGCFLLAHIAYITAFIVKGVNYRWSAVAAVPVLLIAALVSIWLEPSLPDELALPVLVYTAVISMMVIAAFGCKAAGASMLLLVGALLFFVSDLSVAAQRIVQVEFPTFVWGLPMYYAGQLCLALSTSQSSSQ
ncbi:MAG: lysoplasmalogenase [Gammaproteobacteria bacterium]|nr:lysoplasmalogenase [Gammaproteobacteria bacterium]